MKKLVNKIFSFIVSLTVLFSMTSATQVYAQEKQNIIVDGYTFEIVSKNAEEVKLVYRDECNEYIFYLNRKNIFGKVNMVISKTNLLSRRDVTSDYKVNFDETVEYNADTADFSSVVLVDESTGDEYSLNPDTRLAYIIPVGIPLLAAAIEALLVAGSAIIIAGVVYTMVEEVAEALKRQNNYQYYAAVLREGAVYVGGGLTRTQAQSLAYTDDSSGKILATSLAYARGLVGNSYRGPEIHGGGEGFWNHIHAKRGYVTYLTHIWYL